MEQCRQGKSAKWIHNLGKSIGSEGWARGSHCSCGESGSPRAGRGTDWERSLWRSSPGVEQSTQNWYRQGESDCLIKTKHCDGPCRCSRNRQGIAPLFGPKARLDGPIRAEDIVRWGVWLGRHIC
ncbi:hypothetical protein I3842_05G151200 [Carya illinoinensis]|uniref:Uncharacterized protein n=1 Tax=Carya illinoinensis TaxID=32201 RepID=A0A922EZR6_CARIL|nr:hypothetical protein I3842_05G151200 [Carya illinoinensis]